METENKNVSPKIRILTNNIFALISQAASSKSYCTAGVEAFLKADDEKILLQ
jgi:hypothetical protein